MHHIYYVGYILYLFVIVSLVFFDRNKPIQRFNWILVLVFIPVIGLLLYLFIGSDYYLKYKKRQLLKRYGDSYYALEEAINVESTQELNDTTMARKFHEKYCGSMLTADNDVMIFTAGSVKFRELFKDLKEAEENIHLFYFTIHNDKLGQELINILTEKALQGVEVKLLYDGLGCFMTLGFGGSLFKKLKEAGGQVIKMRPHVLDVNYRNHRKIVVIDGKIGYTGGMNVGDQYRYGLMEIPWRDTHIRITGSAVHGLQYVFLSDWISSLREPCERLNKTLPNYFPAPEQEGSLAMQIIASGLYNKFKNDEIIKLSYYNLISRANKRVWIQTPYFAPSDIIVEALKTLAYLGVDVRIMTSSYYIFGGLFHQNIANYFLRSLLDSGVRVFNYNGVMHAKTMLVDDNAVCIGTVNLNGRSLEKDDELYAYVESTEFASIYEGIYYDDLKFCQEHDYDKFRKQRPLSRAFESVLSFLSPLS
ncbi:cardiolipin synthase [Dethiobacter alkaliphilus]|uniref:cardiolipin synthase n=1 Tax=Dethiobacter alkaliphilus TaxID=427926 RepID=UPI002225E382|nr:cardiolipin synthase [Dethiobacter alkaliphilus]MCW3491577.1 cardiolipin synthase [Dethiobacter alkaliphilus]